MIHGQWKANATLGRTPRGWLYILGQSVAGCRRAYEIGGICRPLSPEPQLIYRPLDGLLTQSFE
jgi:hypothetical protein